MSAEERTFSPTIRVRFNPVLGDDNVPEGQVKYRVHLGGLASLPDDKQNPKAFDGIYRQVMTLVRKLSVDNRKIMAPDTIQTHVTFRDGNVEEPEYYILVRENGKYQDYIRTDGLSQAIEEELNKPKQRA